MKISVIIPNYNGEKLLEKNLAEVIRKSQGAEIIVVDDCSTDQSVSFLKRKFPGIKAIVKDKNEGFASTVNTGVSEATGDLVYLLNSDVVPKDKYLDFLIPHFRDPKVFAVASLQENTENGKTVLRGRGIGSFCKGFLYHSRGEVDKKDTLWVSGGAGCFRKRIWEKLGGLNTLYNPFYWEDIDLSYRALKAGFNIMFENKSVVVHRQEKGAIRSKYSKSQVQTISYRNQIIFVWLNISDINYLFSHKIYILYLITKSLMRGDINFLKGYFSAHFLLIKILLCRFNNQKNWKISDKEILRQFLT